MALLTTTERQQIWRGLMRWWSRERLAVTGLTKIDLQVAVDAVDNWIDANAASYNAALPVAARTNLTVAQKAALLVVVMLRRFRVGSLRQIVGEVD